ALDFLRPARLLAGGRLAPRPLGSRAGQHAVFGRDPAACPALEPGGHRLACGRGAEHMGFAESDEAGALGMTRDAALEADGPERVGGAFRRADDGEVPPQKRGTLEEPPARSKPFPQEIGRMPCAGKGERLPPLTMAETETRAPSAELFAAGV